MRTNDERDVGDDALPQAEELREMETIVRAATLTTTRAFDERVMRESFAPHHALPRGVRVAAGIVVAIALGGALTAAVVGWLRRGREAASDGPEGTLASHASAPSRNAKRAQAARVLERPAVPPDGAAPRTESSEADADDVIEESEGSSIGTGLPITIDARATVREAPIIARIRLNGVVMTLKSGFIDPRRGTIEAVYKGDAALIGRGVTIHAKRLATRTSFICWSQEGKTSFGQGVGTVVMPLEPTNVGIPKTGDVHLRAAFADLFDGTLVASKLPIRAATSIEDEILAMLREDFVASLSAPNVSVRRSSIQALRNWNWSGAVPDPDSIELWRDEPTAKALLAAGRDDDPIVRSTVAWMVNSAAGAAGRDLLEELLFDPDTFVRQLDATWLRHQGGPQFLEAMESVRDLEWDKFLSAMPFPLATELSRGDSAATLRDLKLQELKEGDQPERRAEIAWAFGRTRPSRETTEALLAALGDPDFEVRRGAAHSLGNVGGEGVTEQLDGVANNEDPRVRVMAAWSQVKLGDKRGYAHLSRLMAGDDARAATQACEALGRIAKKDAVALLLNAADDARPLVRGAAVTALAQRAQKSDAPHRAAVDALLARLAKDDDIYVRAAARAALVQRERAGAKSGADVSVEDRRRLTALGYGVDEDPDGE